MKLYVMHRFGSGQLSAIVCGDAGSVRLKHLVRHSPDGFEWGYGGSGPADLARSIVGDLFEDPDPPPAIYQAVNRELVAKLPRCGGQITEAEVNDVIDGPGVL